MGNALASMFASKKFLAAFASVVVYGAAKIGWNVTPEEIMPILSPILAYIVGQGIADHGKERAKVETTGRDGGTPT